jgi:hypothetical protein
MSGRTAANPLGGAGAGFQQFSARDFVYEITSLDQIRGTRAKRYLSIGIGAAMVIASAWALAPGETNSAPEPEPPKAPAAALAQPAAQEEAHALEYADPEDAPPADAPAAQEAPPPAPAPAVEAPAPALARTTTERAERPARAQRETGTGTIELDTQPSVFVYQNGRQLGRTPLKLELDAGTQELELRDARYHISMKKKLTVKAGATTPVDLDFGVAKLVLAAPDGAEVKLDGKPIGEAPLDPIGVIEGSHRIQVTHEGMSYDETLDVPAGSTVRVRVRF